MFSRRNLGKRSERSDRPREPMTTIIPNERVAAMQKVAQTNHFGVNVVVTAQQGEQYRYRNGGTRTVPQGKSHVAIHGDPLGGLSDFYRAVKSVQRHDKKQQRKRQ